MLNACCTDSLRHSIDGNLLNTEIIVCNGLSIVAVAALWKLKENFHAYLDYIEFTTRSKN